MLQAKEQDKALEKQLNKTERQDIYQIKNSKVQNIAYKNAQWENQDGGVGRHTAPPRTTRTDRKLNSKEVQHQVDKKETYIQTGRRGGDGHRGREDSPGRGGTQSGGVWDERGGQSDH